MILFHSAPPPSSPTSCLSTILFSFPLFPFSLFLSSVPHRVLEADQLRFLQQANPSPLSSVFTFPSHFTVFLKYSVFLIRSEVCFSPSFLFSTLSSICHQFFFFRLCFLSFCSIFFSFPVLPPALGTF